MVMAATAEVVATVAAAAAAAAAATTAVHLWGARGSRHHALFKFILTSVLVLVFVVS